MTSPVAAPISGTVTALTLETDQTEQAPISDGDGAPTLYRVTVRPERQSILAYGHEQQFKAGMTLEAGILQDRRRLIEWLIEPLISAATGRVR